MVRLLKVKMWLETANARKEDMLAANAALKSNVDKRTGSFHLHEGE